MQSIKNNLFGIGIVLLIAAFLGIWFVACGQTLFTEPPQDQGKVVKSVPVETTYIPVQTEFAVPIELLMIDMKNAINIERDYIHFRIKNNKIYLVPAVTIYWNKEPGDEINAFPPPPGGP